MRGLCVNLTVGGKKKARSHSCVVRLMKTALPRAPATNWARVVSDCPKSVRHDRNSGTWVDNLRGRCYHRGLFADSQPLHVLYSGEPMGRAEGLVVARSPSELVHGLAHDTSQRLCLY